MKYAASVLIKLCKSNWFNRMTKFWYLSDTKTPLFGKIHFLDLIRHWPSTGQVFKKLKSIPNVIGANEISKYLISKACFQIWSKFMTPFSFSNLKKPEYMLNNILTFVEILKNIPCWEIIWSFRIEDKVTGFGQI